MPAKPPACRVLDQRRVPYHLVTFDPGLRDALEVAQTTGHDPARVFKTLVVEEDPPRGKPYLVMAPAGRELDLKALAAALSLKRMRMASHTDAERVTGLRVGGISAVAMAGRGFRAYIDASALAFDSVLVSAGARGFDVELRTSDLIAVTGALIVDGFLRTADVES